MKCCSEEQKLRRHVWGVNTDPNDIQTKAAQSSKSGPNKPLQLWIPICGLWTNHYSLSICFSWLPQIDCKWLQMVTRLDAPTFIYFSWNGWLSLFSLHLILSKYHLYSASPWCESWISHGEFAVGAPKRAMLTACPTHVIIRRFLTGQDTTRKNKCVDTQRQRRFSECDHTELYIRRWHFQSKFCRGLSARMLILICGHLNTMQQLHIGPV